jgi:hypothetical protein
MAIVASHVDGSAFISLFIIISSLFAGYINGVFVELSLGTNVIFLIESYMFRIKNTREKNDA